MTFQYISLSFHCEILPAKIKSQSSESSDKELTLCRFRDSFSICNTCSNRLWSHPFCCPYQVGVPVLLISDAHLTTVLLLEPQNFLQNLGLTRSDSPSCKMSNTVIQVHGNKQGSLVVSSSPHRQSSKRVKMHQLTKRSHQHRYLTLSPFANVHC